MTWVLVFVALAVLALIAIAACAWPVFTATKALFKQLGAASESFGESMEQLTEALEGSAIREPSSRRR